MTTTEKDLRMLARSDPGQALDLAEMFGYVDLALEIATGEAETASVDYSGNPFQLAYAGKFNMTDVARAADVPASTVQAACAGRVAGNMTVKQRRALSAFLKIKRDALDKALAELEN